MPRGFATPPPPPPPPLLGQDGMLVHRREYVFGTHLYTWVKRETKWSKVPCLMKQRDGRGLDPGPPDPKFEASTARSRIPTQGGL